MSNSIDTGLKIAAEIVDETTLNRMKAAVGSDAFGAKLGEFAVDLAFGKVWSRPGMSRHDRSLVTLGILIASRSQEELKIHTLAAIRNGVSVKEIEEVLYQACVYAGFPATASAAGVIITTLREAGHLS